MGSMVVLLMSTLKLWRCPPSTCLLPWTTFYGSVLRECIQASLNIFIFLLNHWPCYSQPSCLYNWLKPQAEKIKQKCASGFGQWGSLLPAAFTYNKLQIFVHYDYPNDGGGGGVCMCVCECVHMCTHVYVCLFGRKGQDTNIWKSNFKTLCKGALIWFSSWLPH